MYHSTFRRRMQALFCGRHGGRHGGTAERTRKPRACGPRAEALRSAAGGLLRLPISGWYSVEPAKVGIEPQGGLAFLCGVCQTQQIKENFFSSLVGKIFQSRFSPALFFRVPRKIGQKARPFSGRSATRWTGWAATVPLRQSAPKKSTPTIKVPMMRRFASCTPALRLVSRQSEFGFIRSGIRGFLWKVRSDKCR